MRNHFYILMCTFISVLAGCANGNKESPATADSASAVPAAIAVTDSTTAMPEDPDPSDSIQAAAYGINTYGKATEDMIRKRLQELFKDDLDKNIIDSNSRKFILFQYDLNNDSSKEIFVGFTGSYFCGTGGCTIYLLDGKAQKIASFSVTDYPIVIANTTTRGWKDLVLSSGGKNHLMKFNGKTYPGNPSVQPVMKLPPGDEEPRALDYLHEPYPWFWF